MYAYVAHFLRDGFGIDVVSDLPLEAVSLVGKPELTRLSGISETQGFVRYRIAASTLRRLPAASNFEVSLLYGLPAIATAAALAHEMFHVYSAKRGLGLTHKREEGAANLVSYILLRTQTNSAEAKVFAKSLIQSSDPIYGGGFRHALHSYRQAGDFASFLATERQASLVSDALANERECVGTLRNLLRIAVSDAGSRRFLRAR